MQVWDVLHAARDNRGCKNDAKNCHLRTIAQLCRAVSLQLKHVLTTGKKLVKQQYLPTCPFNRVNYTSGWDYFVSLGHPSKFQWVSRLGFVTAATSLTGGQPNFAQCLAVSWAATLYIHFRGLPPDRISPGAKFTLRPSLAFPHIGSVTARQSSSGCQPNFAACYKEWNYGTFAEGVTDSRLSSFMLGIGSHSSSTLFHNFLILQSWLKPHLFHKSFLSQDCFHGLHFLITEK